MIIIDKQEVLRIYMDNLIMGLENNLKKENELIVDMEDAILVSQFILYRDEVEEVFDALSKDMYVRLRYQLQMVKKGIYLEIVPNLFDWNGFEIVRITAYKMSEK